MSPQMELATNRAETIAYIVPGAHELQRGLVFVTRTMQLLHTPHTLVLYCIYIIISLLISLSAGHRSSLWITHKEKGPSTRAQGWWVLTTVNAAGTSLTCFPKHGGAQDNKFWSPIRWPMLLSFHDRTSSALTVIDLLDGGKHKEIGT
jgi:hypothetical protein